MPRKEEVVTQALCASTMPSTGTSAEIPDYDNKVAVDCQQTLPARNSLTLSSSSVVSKPGRITPRVCLANDAGEDVATTTGYANTTKHDTTTATGTSVSMATASTTTPVFQLEEEAPAASLPGARVHGSCFAQKVCGRSSRGSLPEAVPGPVSSDVSASKKLVYFGAGQNE
ncbi:uncharacterized protein LOC135825642 isoform X3 [Sycon ciliatum]|uniref:uncharacterized protein LOC135825642 isoform X3 n=1 Tax=Sycon ciliatum TaxID=27933 RepID=UPI0031F5F537